MDSFLPADCHWKISELYEYWRSRAGLRDIPARADLDPVDIPHLLPDVFLIDVGPEGGKLVYRLAGTALADLFGEELTGQEVGAGTLEQHKAEVRARYARIVRERRPFFQRAQLHEKTNDFTHIERVILPMAPEGGEVNMLLGMVVRRESE